MFNDSDKGQTQYCEECQKYHNLIDYIRKICNTALQDDSKDFSIIGVNAMFIRKILEAINNANI